MDQTWTMTSRVWSYLKSKSVGGNTEVDYDCEVVLENSES